MKRLFLALLLAAAGASAQPSCAPVSTRCVGAGQEYSTIQAAANASAPGDLVYVFAGTYGGFQVNVSGTASQPITYLAQTGAVVNSGGDAQGDAIDVESANYITIDGFEVSHAPRIGVRAVQCTGCIVRNVYVHDSVSDGVLTGFAVNFQLYSSRIELNGTNGGDHNVYLSNSNAAYNGLFVHDNVIDNPNAGNNIQLNADCDTLDTSGVSTGKITGFLIERNLIYGGLVHAIMLIDASGGIIRNNVMYGMANSGVQTGTQTGCNVGNSPGSNNNLIVNNTIDMGTGTAGVRVVQPSSGTVFFNNIVVTGDPRDCVDDASGQNCATGSDGMGYYRVGLKLTTTTAATGVFGSYSGHDYTLAPGSAAIDTGVASGGGAAAPKADMLFNGRPFGAGYDLGAYEYGASALSADVTPPSTPGTPTAVTGAYRIAISWTPSTDNMDVAWYVIYRNGAPYGSSTSSSYTDVQTVPSTAYTYTVSALDSSWNLSAASGTLSVSAYGVAGCLNADNTFRSVLTQAESGGYEFTADMTPFNGATNAIVGLGPVAPGAYSDMAAQIGFEPTGVVLVRNGGSYASDATYGYSSGTSYHFRVPVNVSTHTYSVYVSTGGSETELALNYAFRTGHGADLDTNYLGVTVDPSATGSVAVCSPAINGIPLAGLSFVPVLQQNMSTQAVSTVTTDANGSGKPLLDRPKPPSLTASRLLSVSDNAGLLEYVGSPPITVTVPQGLGLGFSATTVQGGAGVVSFVADTGVTLVNRSSATHTVARGSAAIVQCSSVTPNLCYLWGDVR